MIRSRFAWLAVVCAGWMSSASAQVFYEPVQYQYQYGSQSFYYGGHNARMFDYAAQEIRSQSYSSVATSMHGSSRGYVYSDGVPFRNLSERTYTGYATFTANDARNEAYNNVPRYFRKSDLLRAAVVTEEGSVVVPAQAQPMLEIRVVRPFRAEAAPVVPKGTILVIPRKWLEKPAKKAGEPSVAAAG